MHAFIHIPNIHPHIHVYCLFQGFLCLYHSYKHKCAQLGWKNTHEHVQFYVKITLKTRTHTHKHTRANTQKYTHNNISRLFNMHAYIRTNIRHLSKTYLRGAGRARGHSLLYKSYKSLISIILPFCKAIRMYMNVYTYFVCMYVYVCVYMYVCVYICSMQINVCMYVYVC